MTLSAPSILDNAHVTIFIGSTNIRPVEIVYPSLSVHLQRVQDGTYRCRCRKAPALTRHCGQQGRYDARQENAAWAFTPAGVFARRANVKLTTPSGLSNFDFDHPPDLAEAEARLMEDPGSSTPSSVRLAMASRRLYGQMALSTTDVQTRLAHGGGLLRAHLPRPGRNQ